MDKSGLAKSSKNSIQKPTMSTIFLNAGRKDKLRPGDILGSLTADGYLSGDKIGKITIFDKVSYVAVQSGVAKLAMKALTEGKVKGRRIRSRLIG